MRRDAVIRTEAGKTLSIDACVSAYREPDVFRVDIEFSGNEGTKADCFASYKKSVIAAEEAFKAAGFDPNEIKSDQLSISPSFRHVYEKVDDERYRVFTEALYRRNELVDGYEYDSSAYAEYPFDGNMEAVEGLWRSLLALGEGTSCGFSFDLADKQGAKEALIAEAIGQARRRAELHASALSYKLGDVVHVEAESVKRELYRCKNVHGELPESAPLFRPEPVEVSCSARIDWQLV